MKRGDILLIIFGLLLLAAMLYTIFFSGEKSRHGIGSIYEGKVIPAFVSRIFISSWGGY